MNAESPIWAPDADADRKREKRINLALLRGALENLGTNRKFAPLLTVVVAGMFSQWVPLSAIAAWFALVMAAVAAQLVMVRHFPKGELGFARARRWTLIASGVNLLTVACWTSMVWLLWVPGSEFNHMLIVIVLAATLAAHSTLAGACPALSVPVFILYGAMMALVPLHDQSPQSLYMALVIPFYVWYIARIAGQNHTRARATVVLLEERDSLLAELVMSKIESDRGRERAEAASLAKSQFLANMSHELRTPLNAILGFSEVIAAGMFANEPSRNAEYAKLINSSGHHLLALINDILDLAKIEAGRWKLEEQDVDLYRLAEDAMQLVQWKAKDNNASLDNTIDQDGPTVFADERAIKQILLNLLSNAVKFTPEHGHVTVFAAPGEDGSLSFGVADTGVGIAPDDQARVFDSFGQGKHDVAIVDKGTGLGLAIVKGLTEAHGGRISLESQVGKGTRVTVTLPRARVRHRAQREPAHFVA